MENLPIPKFTFYVIAPFNANMILDYSSLIGKYDNFRKLLCSKLQKKYPNQILIEKFANGDNPIESIRNWITGGDVMIQRSLDDLLFKGTGGSGVTQRDKSIITVQINQRIELPLDIIGIDIFNSPPTLHLETMSFHEYGIGMIYCKLDIKFKQDFMTFEQIKPRKIMADLLDKIVRNSDLLRRTESIGTDVFETYIEILEEFEIKKPLMTYKDLFGIQKSSIPLWGHIVLVRNKINKDEVIPINKIMNEVIEVSHPEGSINFAKDTEGFVHIGWGNSLWAGLNQVELNYAKEVLRYLEIEWRTLQVFNNILYKRVNQLASYQTLQKRRVRRTVRWINKLRMEMELYSLSKQNYLQNLAPFAHFIYNEAVLSWRNSQMEEFFTDKLDVFQYLHERGKERLQELSDSKINDILFIFTCLSLISTFIDGLTFVFANHIAESLVFRLFLLIFPPLAFIIIIVLIIERFISSKK
ncbi:MAG: hypothetical protein ACFFB0_17345 [Promethearchaeota archaeon]